MRSSSWSRLAKVALAGWAILCVAALASFLYDVSILGGPEQSGLLAELELRLTLELLILNLPISLLPVVLSPLLPDLGVGPVLEWSLLVFLGLLQWTIIVPFAVECSRRIGANLSDEAAEQKG